MLRARHSGFEKPVGLQGQYLARQFNSTKGGVLVPSGTPSCTSRKYTEGSQVSHVARHGVKEMDTVKWAGGLPGLGSQAGWATLHLPVFLWTERRLLCPSAQGQQSPEVSISYDVLGSKGCDPDR